MISVKDIYYIAGLLEGEGSFGFYGCAVLQLSMTDFDTVLKAQKIIDSSANIRTQKKKGTNNKIQYHLHVSGSIAAQWMMTIYLLMGERRKLKIKEVLTKWKVQSRPTHEQYVENGIKSRMAMKLSKYKNISIEEAFKLINQSEIVN